jgi:hypothetical protein
MLCRSALLLLSASALVLAGCTADSSPGSDARAAVSPDVSNTDDRVASSQDYALAFGLHDKFLAETADTLGDCLYRPYSETVARCRKAPPLLGRQLTFFLREVRGLQRPGSPTYIGAPPPSMVEDVKTVVESARDLRNVVDEAKSAACEYGDKGHCRGFYAHISMRTGKFLVEMSQVAPPREP